MPYPHIINFMIMYGNIPTKQVSNSQLALSHDLNDIISFLTTNYNTDFQIQRNFYKYILLPKFNVSFPSIIVIAS